MKQRHPDNIIMCRLYHQSCPDRMNTGAGGPPGLRRSTKPGSVRCGSVVSGDNKISRPPLFLEDRVHNVHGPVAGLGKSGMGCKSSTDKDTGAGGKMMTRLKVCLKGCPGYRVREVIDRVRYDISTDYREKNQSLTEIRIAAGPMRGKWY